MALARSYAMARHRLALVIIIVVVVDDEILAY